MITNGWSYQPVPRKVVEKTIERKYDENHNCIWEKVTETEKTVYDYSYPQWWQQPVVSYTTQALAQP